MSFNILALAEESIAENLIQTSELSNFDKSFSLGFGGEYFRIDGLDPVTKQTAMILSTYSPYMDIGFLFEWYKINILSFNMRVEQYTFQGLNDGQTYTNQYGTIQKYSLKLINRLTDEIMFGIGIDYDQELFFHAVTGTQLYTDRIPIIKPGLNLGLQILELENFGLYISGEAAFTTPSTKLFYSIESGSQLGIIGKLQYYYIKKPEIDLPKKNILELVCSYYYQKQFATISSRVVHSLGLGINLIWQIN
ncbi:MAG: hypothetical protein K2X39_05600 [Silvanigrellaceae bacterium]|nr:hypothetical protein [Silvanigrellaceae bacterium]